MIQVRGISKAYGPVAAVNALSFRVQAGDLCGVVGSDGAGKTTLLRMLATMLPPATGTILVAGKDAVKERRAVRDRVGYMPQRFGLYQDLTVAENLDFFMDIHGITGRERARRRERYLGFSNLIPFLDRRAGDLSGGMKQKLGLACVLVHEPRVLILDEPTNGVDPVSRQEFWGILADMKREGMTTVVSTAYLDEGEKCDTLLLMHRAHLFAHDTPRAIRAGFPDLEEAMVTRILTQDRQGVEGSIGD